MTREERLSADGFTDEGEVTLRLARRLILGAGSTYTFPAWNLHETNHVGLTATIMDKIAAPADYGRPRVLVPVGSKPDNDFHRDGFDPKELWPYIKGALS